MIYSWTILLIIVKTSHPKVWAGGDIVTGPAMVVDAIRAGRDAAKAIDIEIRNAKGEPFWVPTVEEINIPVEIDEETVEQPQTPMPELAASERRHNFNEVELGYTVEKALAEARRCMRCDVQIT